MNTKRILLGLSLLLAGTQLMTAQVSNDNEDEVYKVDQRFSKDYVPGQVLVKMKDGSPATVRRVKGKFQSAGLSELDAVLSEFGVEEMEQLLPKAKVAGKPRRAKAFNGTTIVERDLTQLYKVSLPEDKIHETMQLVERLKALDEVEYAEPNYKMYITDAEIAGSFLGNPYVTQQWYLDAYGVKQLWNKPVVNPTRPVIAIIDTGVDLTHPDLAPNLWTNTAEAEGEANYDNDGNGFKGDVHGWDFINNTPNVRDFNMHGTHVAGIAAAANNGIGIVGANPQALIMPVSVMQSDGTGDIATIVKGINYAVANGATILNLSLGTYANSNALRQALANAYQNAVIVAAAGNDGRCINSPHNPVPCFGAAPMFPAAYSFVLGVQATTNTGSLAGFSNYDDDGNTYSSRTTLQDPDGFNYELKAPGTNMLSTIPGGKYKVLQGTSMAAPLVAGAISALTMVKDYTKDEGLIHQEILWGDLLHTDNIAQAYAVTNRPAELDLMKIMYRERKELSEETEDDYSGDGEIDAGETVSLYPVIRTTFGAASNIKMHLEMGDEFEDPSTVEILTGPDNKVDFGLHLDAYGKGVSLNPLRLKVADNIADNRHIKMKMVATCDESNVIYEGLFTIVVNNMVKISGLISEDRTLTADHIYYVNENLGIMEGATLTIEPGTRLEFAENMGLSSYGKLSAKGTPEKPIVFTGHYDAMWGGITSHRSTGQHNHDAVLYTDDDHTIFTLLPTENTPNQIVGTQLAHKILYYDANEVAPIKPFYLKDYMEEFSDDMTDKQDKLIDPNYLAPAVQRLLNDFEVYCSQHATEWSAGKNATNAGAVLFSWNIYDNPRDTISYCKLDGYSATDSSYKPYMRDCQITSFHGGNVLNNLDGERLNISKLVGWANIPWQSIFSSNQSRIRKSNVININISQFSEQYDILRYSWLKEWNYLNNFVTCKRPGKYYGSQFLLGIISEYPEIDYADSPSYLGTSKESIIRPFIYEIGNGNNTYGQIDLSNMLTEPVREAHGIVWKVCVNGKDAQDEYEDLAPLGVGKHKFEVYFNRPMNKAVAPNISFGVRDPWTQNAVAEDGSWNEEGTIYTAYKTITGKTKSDGVNRIYVYGAEDNEYFECPYEKTRFNVMINAAGSMATGFAAEAKMGRVNLTWNNENNNFDDAMGFNIYRYGEAYEKTLPAGYYNGYKPTEWGQGTYYGQRTVIMADTVCLNQEIVDIETTEFTDYDVKPGETYYYYYKVLSTDLKEYDVSNVVAATPLTATLGDANGSGEVDVADVITTVNYAAGMEPKPFIFEAADMNTDQSIDILDVIGIIQKILNPSAAREMSIESTATYTIENGVLYVESPVALAGVQVQLNLDAQKDIKVADDLNGFEHTSAWLTDNDYLFLAYNMNGKTLTAGKHALLEIGDANITTLRLSDAQGHNVLAIADETTSITTLGSKVKLQGGIFNLKGQKVSGKALDLKKLPKGVYIINGEKVVK